MAETHLAEQHIFLLWHTCKDKGPHGAPKHVVNSEICKAEHMGADKTVLADSGALHKLRNQYSNGHRGYLKEECFGFFYLHFGGLPCLATQTRYD